MPFEFKPEDVEKLKNLLSYHPEGEKMASALTDMMTLQDVANTLKYPVNSFNGLLRQLGPEKIIALGGQQTKVADMRELIPAYYFPINSQDDFFGKTAELMRSRPMQPGAVGVAVGPGGITELMQLQPGSQLEYPGLTLGKQIPPEMAPPIPAEILEFKGPSTIPPGRGVGFKKEEIEQMLAARGGEK